MLGDKPSVDEIRRMITRNPYTGGFFVDEDALVNFLDKVWRKGYDAGFDDGVCDSSVENQAVSPYKR